MTDARREVWVAFADQFLDNDERAAIPRAALLAVDAGLSVADAEEIWRYEVAPAVWRNGWSLLGEWRSWEEESLVARIEACRGRWPNRPGIVGRIVSALRVSPLRKVWSTIEGCMDVLAAKEAVERALLAQGLAWLAEVYFGSHATDRSDAASLRPLFEDVFLPLFEPLVVPEAGESRVAYRARVEVHFDPTVVSGR